MDMRRWEIRYRENNKDLVYYVHAKDKAEAEIIFNTEITSVFVEIVSILEKEEKYEDNIHTNIR